MVRRKTNLHDKRDPSKGGRKTKYTKEMDNMAYQCMLRGLNRSDLWSILGVCKDTYYRWLDTHPTFKEAVDRGHNEAVGNVEARMYDIIMGRVQKNTVVKRKDKVTGKMQISESRAEDIEPSDKMISSWLHVKSDNWKFMNEGANVNVSIENKITNEDIKAAEKAIEGELDNLIDIPDLDDNNG